MCFCCEDCIIKYHLKFADAKKPTFTTLDVGIEKAEINL